MLGQRLDKSQTLPRLDGQDEGETLETQFDIMSIANSCPDLSVLEESSEDNHHNGLTGTLSQEDVVDGIFIKNSIHGIPHIPMKLPLSFRRSTSLNSLVADEFKETSNAVDGNVVGVMLQPGSVAKAVGKLEGLVQNDSSGASQDFPFLRPSNTGTLHKSISTPSVPHIFGQVINVTSDLPKNSSHSNHRIPSIQSSFSQQQSSKRSFFRRKQKSKSNSINSHPPVVVQHYRNIKMETSPYSYIPTTSDEESQESVGYIALSNPSLGLQDPDAECWAMFMGEDVVSLLDGKEVKRQEHMYELILTEKHHCLTLALMHHLFVGGMKKAGYTRTARILFPGLVELLQVHFSFLRRMRERQLKFRDMGQPMDTLSDLIMEQFTGEGWQQMVRLYGLLCSSHKTSLELFKLMQKESKFAALVAYWSKCQLLARKNVPECLLLVAQRITKYPLLFEPLHKTAPSQEEKDQITKTLKASRDLNEKVNERVAERERLIEFCKKIDTKSMILMGKRRIHKDDLTLVPSRRLLFTGTANVHSRGLGGKDGSGYGGGPGTKSLHCTVLILTDCLVFTQDISNNGVRYHFVSPPILPGIVMLNHLIVRENAGQNSSLFLVLGTGTDKPEMIQLDVCNPPNRKEWINTILGAIAKSQEEGDITSDGDDEFLSDTAEYQDSKTTRALEELQDQDRQILSLLRSRSKIVESLRTDKPHLWAANHFEDFGKVEVLNAVSNASSEVQRMLHNLDANSVSVVNRSASCVSEHVTQGVLPRRADTFGGFDSQQRSSIDFAHSVNNKVLFQMVIQLADLCGEIFQQMIPQLTPQNQNQHQLQRRMEDLREAQQRLEAEKAEWQRVRASQKDEIESQQNILESKANDLRKEEKDIVQQREQLYRKLEALQRQGIRPNLDSVSPSQSTNIEKISTPSIQPRRTVSQTHLPVVPPTATVTNGQKPPKQQIPHFLANSSSVKSATAPPPTSPTAGTEAPKPLPRTLGLSGGTSKPPAAPSPAEYISKHRSSQGKGPSSRGLSRGASQPVQQLLPYRLSEDLKTSSLPRGVGSRSSSSMSHSHSVDQQLLIPANTSSGSGNLSKLRSGSSASHVLHSSAAMYAGESLNTDRMSSYYKNDPRKANGYMEYPYGPSIINSSVPIVHQRSGSSPVPMSTMNSNPTTTNYPRDDDFDSTKVLFL